MNITWIKNHGTHLFLDHCPTGFGSTPRATAGVHSHELNLVFFQKSNIQYIKFEFTRSIYKNKKQKTKLPLPWSTTPWREIWDYFFSKI